MFKYELTRSVPAPITIDGKTFKLADNVIAALKTIGFMNLDKLVEDGKVTLNDFPFAKW